MEWRQQTSLSCADAFNEAQRWIEKVTGKSFNCTDFRAALENGVLLCDLINQLKPGIIKRVNRLSTPIAGLDNVSLFLKACGKLSLNESQLFHPGDLQDLSSRVTLKRDESNRRLKNVLITIYWLGRKANQDLLYKGPQLNFKAFEGLLGLALSRALDDASSCSYPEKDEIYCKRPSYKRLSSVDSVESLDAKATTTNGEGCGSDAEAEQVFKMEATHPSTQTNKGYLPPSLQKAKQARGYHGKGCTSPLSRPFQIQINPERPVQVNPGWIWSKSLSDIPMVYPVRKVPDENEILDETQETGTRHEFKRKSGATKDTEAQWQDDLTKWKNRRRSSKSDLHRRSQDREHVINQMVNGVVTSFEKTTAQSGPITKEQPSQHSYTTASHPYSSSPTVKSSRSNLRSHTRPLLARSYTTGTSCISPTSYSPQTSQHNLGTIVGTMPTSNVNIAGKEILMASLASVGEAATTPSMNNPFSSQTHVKNSPASILPVFQCQSGDHESPLGFTVLPKETTKSNSVDLTLVNHTAEDTIDDLSIQKFQREDRESSVEGNVEPIKGQGLDKFLTQAGTWSGSASLPRGYRRSEGSSRLSSVISARPFGTKPSRVSSLPRLCNVDDNQLNWVQNTEKSNSVPIILLKRQTATACLKGHSPVSHAVNPTKPSAEREKENSAILSNTIQPNGYHHQPHIQILPQPQLCSAQGQHNNSSVLLKEPSGPVNVDHSDMRVCLTLKPNSRQDFGFQTHWDTKGARIKFIQPGSPAELCRLCVKDEIIAVDGINVTQLDYKQWQNKMTSALLTGSLTMDVRRYGNRGGSESAISDLQVPSLSPSSSSWSWDREEERRRQEKWQEEQERLLQEKYRRDQERLEAEWKKAQQDAFSDMGKKEELKHDAIKTVSRGESQQRLQLHVNGVTNKSPDVQSPAIKDATDKQHSPSEAQEIQHDKTSEDWAKSLSTPSLSSPQNQMRVGAGDQRKRKSQPVSKAEQERQQILDEMKKRTQLLTDNSWIRQRSASFYKEPIMPGVPMKRYESMENLESWRQSPVAAMTFNYPRPQSAAAGYCSSTRTTSSRYSTGSMPPRSTVGSAWAVTEISEDQKLESKSASRTTGRTVSPAIPSSSLPCDQNTALHITE